MDRERKEANNNKNNNNNNQEKSLVKWIAMYIITRTSSNIGMLEKDGETSSDG